VEGVAQAFKLKQGRQQDTLERLAREGRVALGQPNTAAAYPMIPAGVPAGLVDRLIDEDRGDQ
jgi:hypothetical protein